MNEPARNTRRRRPLVVVGCDGHPHGDAALRFAAQEAQLRGARLLVVIAYRRPIDPDLDEFDIPDAQLRRREVAGATFALRRALNQPTGVLPAEVIAVADEPARAILDNAREATMVVVGGQEHSRITHLHTSVLRRLLLESVAPVTVVPPDRG